MYIRNLHGLGRALSATRLTARDPLQSRESGARVKGARQWQTCEWLREGDGSEERQGQVGMGKKGTGKVGEGHTDDGDDFQWQGG